MREIKFRAWDERNKVMHYGFQFIRSGTSGNDWIIFCSDKQTYVVGKDNPYFSQQLKIMEYTGAKDKNGREIYEGDFVIIKANYSGDNWYEDCQALIVFEDYQFIPRNIHEKWGVVGQEYLWQEMEVVGNVYESLISKRIDK